MDDTQSLNLGSIYVSNALEKTGDMFTHTVPLVNVNPSSQNLMTMTPDSNIDNHTSTKKDISEREKQFMDGFRKLLERYEKELFIINKEFTDGLGIQNDKFKDFMEKRIDRIPLSISSIINLHQELINIEDLPKRRHGEKHDKNIPIGELRKSAIDARDKLRADGPDLLLITAGFQPLNLKMVAVSHQQHSQLSFISVLYKDRPFSQDLFFQITDREIDRLKLIDENKDRNNNTKPQKYISSADDKLDGENKDNILLNRLKDSLWIYGETEESILKKYERAIFTINKDKLSSHEAVGLFTSLMNNELNKEEEINFRLKVIGVERTPLTISWDSDITDRFPKLWESIQKNARKCEEYLGNPVSENKHIIYATHPVTRTIITCEYEGKELKLHHISTGTHSRTAISAISLNMGFHHLIPNIKVNIKCFTEDIKSLVKVSVTLKEAKEDDKINRSTSGDWVSSDLHQSLLQALIVASKKWLKDKINSEEKVEKYKLILKETAVIRSDFYKNRLVFDQYDFNDSNSSIDSFIEIQGRANRGTELLDVFKSTLPNDEKKIWNYFSSNFHRIAIGSELYKLHHYNVQCNHDECIKSFQMIEQNLNKFNEDDPEILIPSKISLEAEKIFYNISFGVNYPTSDLQNKSFGKVINLLTVDNISDYLDVMDNKIQQDYVNEYVDGIKDSKDPGYDIHYSLGNYFSVTGRLLMYRSCDDKEMNAACNRLLKAIYYFYRIGLTRKIERNLTLIGRVKVRNKNQQYALECIALSEKILEANIKSGNVPANENFKSAMYSRLKSLQSEYSLTLGKKEYDGLMCGLQALKGSLWIGLNKHTADNLYVISKHIRASINRPIISDLNIVFPGMLNRYIDNEKLSEDEKYSKIYSSFISHPSENEIAKNVISMLVYIRREANKSSTWNIDIADRFEKVSVKIWNDWYKAAHNNKDGQHPFEDKITQGGFLVSYEKLNTQD
jgi:hypothetical protein